MYKQNERGVVEVFNLIVSAVYGIVEGITEWLPISSTGHMLLLNRFVPLSVSADFWDMFVVVIQLGAILAVCAIFFHKLNPFSRCASKRIKIKPYKIRVEAMTYGLPKRSSIKLSKGMPTAAAGIQHTTTFAHNFHVQRRSSFVL